jgi:hypothetical protein
MWLFFGLPILVLFGMLVIHASESLNKIRDNWNEYRCNPIYIPFAGSIRPDVTTQENLLYCLNQMGNDVLKYPLDGIHQLLGTFTSSLGELTGSLGIFRNLFSRMRKFMLSFTASTMNKAASSSSVFIHYLIKIRDVLKRFVGQGYVASYLTYVVFSFLESFIILFISILKTFVIIMLAISFVLALFQPELFAIVLALASILAAAGG